MLKWQLNLWRSTFTRLRLRQSTCISGGNSLSRYPFKYPKMGLHKGQNGRNLNQPFKNRDGRREEKNLDTFYTLLHVFPLGNLFVF